MQYLSWVYPVTLLLFVSVPVVGQTVGQDQPKQPPRAVVAPKTGLDKNDQAESTADPVISEAMRSDIGTLINLNGELNNRLAALINALAVFKSRVPGVKQEFWDECDKLFTKEIVAEELIPVYAKHYSHEEIKGLINFMESPIGNKFVRTFAKINYESNAKLQSFSLNLGNTINEKLEAAGYAR